jgi:hypothetical protein
LSGAYPKGVVAQVIDIDAKRRAFALNSVRWAAAVNDESDGAGAIGRRQDAEL